MQNKLPNLKIGSTGQSVSEVQKYLADAGLYTGRIDGIYGPKTDAAVKAFQAQKNIKIDGIVGPITRSKMGTALKVNDILQNKNVQNLFETEPRTAQVFNQLTNSGDLRDSSVVDMIYDPYLGYDVDERMLDTYFNEEMARNKRAYDEEFSQERGNVEDQLGLYQRNFDRYMQDAESNFQNDKSQDDVNSAKSGILFSTARQQNQKNLQDSYARDLASKRDNDATQMSQILRNFGYSWGANNTNPLIQNYGKLGNQSYDATGGKGVVSSGGLSSFYNPNQVENNYYGIKNVNREVGAKVAASRRLGNYLNKNSNISSSRNTRY